MKKKRGRHENPIDDPYKGLAASIVLRAIKDIKCQDMQSSSLSTKDEDLQRVTDEAVAWLREDKWCETLLDYLDFTISGGEILCLINAQRDNQ